MTTKVTVDAYAGWPVEVIVVDLVNLDGTTIESNFTVQPGSVQDFYVHSQRSLRIKELKLPE